MALESVHCELVESTTKHDSTKVNEIYSFFPSSQVIPSFSDPSCHKENTCFSFTLSFPSLRLSLFGILKIVFILPSRRT